MLQDNPAKTRCLCVALVGLCFSRNEMNVQELQAKHFPVSV